MKTARSSRSHWLELLVKPGSKAPEPVPALARTTAAMAVNIGFLEDLRKMLYPALARGQRMRKDAATTVRKPSRDPKSRRRRKRSTEG